MILEILRDLKDLERAADTSTRVRFLYIAVSVLKVAFSGSQGAAKGVKFMSAVPIVS